MTSVMKRSSRKYLVGVVTSRSGDKTIKVEYQYKVPHPRYKIGLTNISLRMNLSKVCENQYGANVGYLVGKRL